MEQAPKPEITVKMVRALKDRINRAASTNIDIIDLLNKIQPFDDMLKIDLMGKYSNIDFLQMIPVWQVLIGGSEKPRHDITPQPRISPTAEQFQDVTDQIATFILQLEDDLRQMENK